VAECIRRGATAPDRLAQWVSNSKKEQEHAQAYGLAKRVVNSQRALERVQGDHDENFASHISCSHQIEKIEAELKEIKGSLQPYFSKRTARINELHDVDIYRRCVVAQLTMFDQISHLRSLQAPSRPGLPGSSSLLLLSDSDKISDDSGSSTADQVSADAFGWQHIKPEALWNLSRATDYLSKLGTGNDNASNLDLFIESLYLVLMHHAQYASMR
jgi:hypothetical protein